MKTHGQIIDIWWSTSGRLRWSRAGIGLAVGLLPAALAGCSKPAAAERVPPPIEVAVADAKSMTVPIMAEPNGTTTPLQEVSIRARVRGFLKEISFQEGTEVKKGQLLFVIDEEPFQAKVAEAEAGLAQFEANLAKARDSKAREVSTAQLALDQAVSALNRVDEARQVALQKRNAAALADVDRATAIRQRSDAQVDADRASLEQAKADYETSILAAKADVEAAKARLSEAKIELSYCRMYSPIDGRAGLVKVKTGNLVGTPSGGPTSAALGGQQYTELAVVRQLDPMGVDIQVSSRYLDRVAPLIGSGLGIEVVRPGLEGESARRMPGRATTIDNEINPTTSTFLVRAEVANPSKSLLPGEFVKVYAKVGELQGAVVVPEQAVVETQAGPTVYTVDEKGTVAVTPVKAAFVYDGLRVVESGLKPGQKVVVEGLQMIRSGMTVKPRNAGAAGAAPKS
jgi:membrane fusion protein, multidrug efflux system